MNKYSTMKDNVKELTEGMQRLCAIANRIVGHQGEVSMIERDMLLEDLRRLYDVALRLHVDGTNNVEQSLVSEEHSAESGERDAEMPDEEMLSSTVMATMAAMSVPAEEPEPAPAPEHTPVPEPEITPEPLSESEPVMEQQPELEIPSEMPKIDDMVTNENSLLFDEVIIEENPKAPSYLEPDLEPAADDHVPTPVQETPVEEAVAMEVSEQTSEPKMGRQASLLDYLKQTVEEKPTVRTIGDTLGEVENGKRNGETGWNQKVSDLRTVININDKFSFMSELFHNNMKAYNDFILRLNSIDTRDEALLCVNEVSAQYKWDENSLAVQSFYKIFDKKF